MIELIRNFFKSRLEIAEIRDHTSCLPVGCELLRTDGSLYPPAVTVDIAAFSVISRKKMRTVEARLR
jgi:hypothetical protein